MKHDVRPSGGTLKVLKIGGLSSAAEQSCRTLYEEFLKEHNLQRYPVEIKVTQTSHTKFLLEIVCGNPSGDYTGERILTSNPEAEVADIFHAELKALFDYMSQKQKDASHPRGGRVRARGGS